MDAFIDWLCQPVILWKSVVWSIVGTIVGLAAGTYFMWRVGLKLLSSVLSPFFRVQ